ncbi:MAG TPA: glycosyltransferase family 4 protein [Gaiellales bacterium]|jgi:glycosyltransferase involved in cell wall biosynthesis
MRVLVLHSRYASGPSSGENRVVEDEVQLLRSAGHDVHLWSPMPDDPTTGSRIGLALSAVWSRTAVAEVRRFERELRPDVVHVHNLFPLLSPAVLRASSAPVVVTLHNYRLLCLPAVFLRDGKACEDCLGKLPWRGVVHRCYRGSAAGSAALATALGVHRRAGTFGHVAMFLAVSDFVREKHLEAGFDPDRIRVKPNFTAPLPRRSGPGRDFLFLGRLSEEKGLDRLVALWHDVPARLVVVGDGPERARLEAMAPATVEFRGSVPSDQVAGFLREARALVLPSICYEGAPRTVVEAYAAGVPVVANRYGALPSVVTNDITGLLVEPGDAGAWRSALGSVLDDGVSERLGEGAFAAWRSGYSPEQALAELEAAYDMVTASARKKRPRTDDGQMAKTGGWRA